MLRDKVIIVTGAASGMGRSTARKCAELGASVVVADLNADGARTVAEDIAAAGGSAISYGVDLTVEDEVSGLADAAIKNFGRINALHNNAYAVHPGAATDVASTSLEAWDWTIRTCLTSQFLCCRAVIPHMLEIGGGSIINVSSGNGLAGSTTAAAYGAAKAGVISLVKTFADELGRYGIRANAVAPGNEGSGNEDQPPHEYAVDGISPLAAPRAHDVANAALFLCSELAARITGQTLVVDGGATIQQLWGLPASSIPPNPDDAIPEFMKPRRWGS